MSDAFTENIRGVSDLVESSVNKINQNGDNPEGVSGEPLDVLDLPMKDEVLLKLRDEWLSSYATYEAKQKEIPRRNLRSYLGRNMRTGELLESDMPGAANLQFEAEETFLPAALARNPDPVVYADNTPEGNKVADDVQTMLKFHADQLLLKRKLEVMVRQWSIHHLGVLKHGWKQFTANNIEKGDITTDNRKIQDFVFDPNGFVDVYGDFSSWLGERITITAKELIDLFPKDKEYITKSVGGEEKLGTEVTYTEWWTDAFCFTTYKEKVLDKHKNEFFNYNEPEEPDSLTGLPPAPKLNHFAAPKKPFTFLSVFSLQERPHDVTGLIEQNIPNQNKISKRVEQIDANVSQSNNGVVFSENNFNQETAKQAANALTNGVGKVLVPPGGPITEAIVRIPAPDFPESGFRDLENSENHLRASWGIQGIASQQPKPDETARGMILNQGRDTSRIGGGISDIVEQSVARSVFNWWVQLYSVFYDDKHFAAVMGTGKATEYVVLSSQNLDRQLIVGVSPNSMAPKDEVSKMNQATELFQMKAIGPKVLLETLNFPNPDESAADGVLWALDPMTYMKLNFPEQFQQLQQAMMEQQQAQAQAQQQQLQMEGQVGQQQLDQKAQAGQQQLEQGAQAHAQKISQGAELHQQKLGQMSDLASAKLKSQTKGKLPK